MTRLVNRLLHGIIIFKQKNFPARPTRYVVRVTRLVHSPREIISTAGKTGRDARWKRKQR